MRDRNQAPCPTYRRIAFAQLLHPRPMLEYRFENACDDQDTDQDDNEYDTAYRAKHENPPIVTEVKHRSAPDVPAVKAGPW